MNGKRALCICASERKNGKEEGISRRICEILEESLAGKRISAKTIDLLKASLTPCDGCGRCAAERRCAKDGDFNRIYDQLWEADYLFFVSPHHAPIPARVCMLLEKMGRLADLHRQSGQSCPPGLFGEPKPPRPTQTGRRPEPSCRQGPCRKLAGIISHAEGGERKLIICKAMVNDTIANALENMGFKVVPFNFQWNTGISFGAAGRSREEERPCAGFPSPEYDWEQIAEKTRMYVEIVVQTSRTLYAIV